MASLEFKVKPEYEGVTGSLVYGNLGQSFDVGEALAGGDSFVTDNEQLQHALKYYEGDNGLVFDWQEADLEAAPIELPEPPEPNPAAGSGTAPEVPAVHSDDSDYSQLTVRELRDEIEARGLDVASDARKDDLVAALDDDDNEREGSR